MLAIVHRLVLNLTLKATTTMTKSTKLADIYFSTRHPASFGGVKKLKNATKQPSKIVKSWLTKQLAYSLNKQIRYKFPTRSYNTSGINELWQMDLMEMIPFARVNKGYKYILTCIDVFSRLARAIPLKNKTGVEVASAMKKMLADVQPTYIQTDLGKEFYNKHVNEVLKNVKLYSVHSQFKAALVERFNRTLRERLARVFTHQGNKVWHNVLDDVIDSYNNSRHRGIFHWKPSAVNKQNEMKLWLMQQQKLAKPRKSTTEDIKLNDYVRISRTKGVFQKRNFEQNWSDEVYRVVAIDNKVYPTMYVLEDLSKNIITGKFYAQELQSLGSELPQVFRIEKIIRSKGVGKHKQHLVKWWGYNDTFNSWIKASSIEKNT